MQLARKSNRNAMVCLKNFSPIHHLMLSKINVQQMQNGANGGWMAWMGVFKYLFGKFNK